MTNLGKLVERLPAETADLKKAIKACEKARSATTAMTPMSDRVKAAMAAMADLTDKQENGESCLMMADYAIKFKKTTDREPLNVTTTETLLADIRNAINDISTAGIVLKHEMKSKA